MQAIAELRAGLGWVSVILLWGLAPMRNLRAPWNRWSENTKSLFRIRPSSRPPRRGRGGRHAVHVLKVRISTAQVADKKTV